jgi:hypothetical protein
MNVPPAKLARMMATSITQIEDTYHRFLKTDDQYGSAVDGYGRAVVFGAPARYSAGGTEEEES